MIVELSENWGESLMLFPDRTGIGSSPLIGFIPFCIILALNVLR